MEQMKAAQDFPPIEAFYSHLTANLTCSREEYEAQKIEFYRRRNLPSTHPDHYDSMADYLRVSFISFYLHEYIFKTYNIADVVPFMRAIQTSFGSFKEHFDINPLQFLSLPSIALRSLFALYDQKCAPPIYSFGKMELCQLFREQVVGGLGNKC